MNSTTSKTIRVRIATAIAVALIALAGTIAAALIGYAASTYQARHHDSSISQGKTGKLTFNKASGQKSATFDITPSTGTLYVSAYQNSGPTGTKYGTYYKLSSKASYSTIATITLNKNKQWSSEKKAGKVKKGKKYNFKVTKLNNPSKKSVVQIDWLLK